MLACLSETGTSYIPQTRREHPHYHPRRLFGLIPDSLRGTQFQPIIPSFGTASGCLGTGSDQREEKRGGCGPLCGVCCREPGG
jgi:hypothetical protein